MLKVKQFEFNMFGENTYLVYDTETKDAAVVDPGMFTDDERAEFDSYVASAGLRIIEVINTHLHLDHCFSDNYVRDRYGVKVAANVGDEPLGLDLGAQIRRFGGRGDMPPVHVDVRLEDGDVISIGKGRIEVIATPGHSRGGICLYCKDGNFLLSGDTLFRRSVGRTDLEGGNARTLVDSIRRRLFVLPDDTVVFPGHERPTTIGEEKRCNPVANSRF